jgi:hypothetical protein
MAGGRRGKDDRKQNTLAELAVTHMCIDFIGNKSKACLTQAEMNYHKIFLYKYTFSMTSRQWWASAMKSSLYFKALIFLRKEKVSL